LLLFKSTQKYSKVLKQKKKKLSKYKGFGVFVTGPIPVSSLHARHEPCKSKGKSQNQACLCFGFFLSIYRAKPVTERSRSDIEVGTAYARSRSDIEVGTAYARSRSDNGDTRRHVKKKCSIKD